MCLHSAEKMWYNFLVEFRKDGGRMFQVNDTVMYGTQGICRIVDITEKDFMGTKKEYYVLKPMSDSSATLFAPTNHEKIAGKMRRILTEEEIYQLIASMPNEETEWIDNENQRKDQYKKVIAGGNHTELIRMIKSLYMHKQEREANGKHLYISDERFFKEAERILYDEFQYVLNIRRDELLPLIFKKIEESMK